jgi:trimeric autotransporter adhesin
LGYCARTGNGDQPANYATAVGGYAQAYQDNSTALGARSQAVGAGSVAVGYGANAQSDGSVAIGQGATARSSVAVGVQSLAGGLNTTAIGDRTQATGDYSVALGNNAKASAGNAVAIGNASVADQPNTVSVGTPGAERRITNVAPGIAPTDAVNLSQLQESQRQSFAGIAMAVALASSKGPALGPGEKSLGAGVGYYGGNSALAITFQGMDRTGTYGYNIGVASNTREWTVGAGVSIRWK